MRKVSGKVASPTDAGVTRLMITKRAPLQCSMDVMSRWSAEDHVSILVPQNINSPKRHLVRLSSLLNIVCIVSQAMLGPLPRGEVGGDIVGPRVCQVLVVDDGSSPKDRGVMMSAFPKFTYVFKGAGDAKGDFRPFSDE